MSSPVRIAYIGAGSAVFSLTMVKDLCLTPALAGSEVVLMDIDADRLDAVATLARRLVQEQGADLRFTATTHRPDALRDADFVIDTAYASGHSNPVRLREVLAGRGYYCSAANLYGPLDIWAFDDLALRLDVARDMERICPDAWLLGSGNPVYEGTTLRTRATGVKVIGICHGHLGYLDMCQVLELDPERVSATSIGLNHQVWLTEFLYDGRDAYPLLDAWIAERAEEHWRTSVQTHPHDIQMSRAAIQLYQLYGLMPIGDTPRDHINWWLHTDLETKKHWFGEPWGGPDTESGRASFVDRLRGESEAAAHVAGDPSASVTDLVGATRSKESHIPIIAALAGQGDGVFQVNVPNNGVIEGIAADVVVELPAKIDASGVHPLPTTPLPRKVLVEQLLPRVNQMEQMLETFVTGDRSMLLWMVLMDRHTRSFEEAQATLDEVLAMPTQRALARHHAPLPDPR